MRPLRFRDLLYWVTPVPPVLALLLGLLLAGSMLSLINPWLAGQVTAVILAQEDALPLATLLAIWLTVLLVRAVLDFWSAYRMGIESEYQCAGLRQHIHDHCHDLPVSYFNETTIGDLLAYFSNDVEVLGRFVVQGMLPVVPALLMLAGAVIFMWQISWLITIIAISLLPFYYVALKLMTRSLRPLGREWMSIYADLLTLVEQRLGNMTLLRVFSNKAVESARYQEMDDRYVALSRRQYLVQSALGPVMSVIAGAGLMLVLFLGAAGINRGELTAPELITFILYANLLRSPLSSLAGLYGQFQQTEGATERLLDLLNTDTEPQEGEHLSIKTGHVEIRDLTFGYDIPLLVNASADISPGEVVALVGANGSGKTTLAYLVMGLIRPPEGCIFIDGQDVAALSPVSVRRQVALVSQNTLLLNDTIAANIGLSGSTDIERVRHAARAVHADGFIEDLPEGYHTLIGNQGLKLSGGQRQKIALARAMFKDAPIVVLDEPTSMFDPDAELTFAGDCRSLFTGRTVLLITHSPRLLPLAHRVLEIKNQQLFSRGT